MPNSFDRFFVVTGGPGAAKSTLVDALEARGFGRSEEAGRGIIRDQVAIGGHVLPWLDARSFAELMLSWEMRSHRLARARKGRVVFDRGVPDVVGYPRLSGLSVPPHVDAAARLFRYNRHVFIAPPWREIYRQDEERKQSFEEAVATYDAMARAYTEFGYELIDLPFDTVEARAAFVMERMRVTGASRSPTTSGPGEGRGGG